MSCAQGSNIRGELLVQGAGVKQKCQCSNRLEKRPLLTDEINVTITEIIVVGVSEQPVRVEV
jgi:hypothetical protein